MIDTDDDDEKDVFHATGVRMLGYIAVLRIPVNPVIHKAMLLFWSTSREIW